MPLLKEYHELKLDALSEDNVEQAREQRNKTLKSLRTPYHLTEEMQRNFYKEVVCNSSANSRYYAIKERSQGGNWNFMGMGGFIPIQWENRCAEISLLILESSQGKGFGEKSVLLLLEEAFDRLNLNMVYGECYASNPAGLKFWTDIASKYHFYATQLPERKYFNGRYHHSLYFSINKNCWERLKGNK